MGNYWDKVLKLGAYDYDPETISTKLNKRLFPFNPEKVETIISIYNPLRFGREYKEEFQSSKNCNVYLHGNLTNFNRSPHNSYIESVTIRTLNNKRFSVRAKHYVMALSGFENPRLMLISNDIEPRGLGNGNDLVGRYFMEHIW